MPPARPRRRVAPDPPDLPAEFRHVTEAPADGETWDGMQAGSDVEFADRVADLEITDSRLVGVDLTSRVLTGFRARNLAFDGCDLAGARLDGASLQRVSFRNCRMDGLLLTGAQLSDVVVEDCRAALMNLRQTEASYLLMSRTTLVEADFAGCRLADSYLYDCALDGADFTGARIRGLDLHGCSLDGVRGALSLANSRVDPDQLVVLGAVALAELGVAAGPRKI